MNFRLTATTFLRDNSVFTFLAISLLLTAQGTAPAQEPRIGGTARLEAWKLHQRMAESSPFKELVWQTLGPKFAGGRIESIDAPRGDTKTIYAGRGRSIKSVTARSNNSATHYRLLDGDDVPPSSARGLRSNCYAYPILSRTRTLRHMDGHLHHL